LNTANSAFGHSDSGAMFSFGEFFSLKNEETNYSVWELWLFSMLGCVGGILGALFVYLNAQLTNARMKLTSYIQRRFMRPSASTSPHGSTLSKQQRQETANVCATWIKLSEVILIITIMTSIAFFLPVYVWGNHCTPLPVDMEEWTNQEKTLFDKLVPLYCNKETHYNELASLYLTDPDTAIKQLFHFRELGGGRAVGSGDSLHPTGSFTHGNSATFSSLALFYFFVPYFLLACVTCGCAVPAGLFVPSLLSGAALGRLVGKCLLLDRLRSHLAHVLF
jgi:chloride channel 7